MDGTTLTKCDQCRQLYAERTPPGDPPCDTCRVELMEENKDVADIFMMCRGQVIFRQEGEQMFTDISIPAVDAAMRMKGIANQWDFLLRVRLLWHQTRSADDAC